MKISVKSMLKWNQHHMKTSKLFLTKKKERKVNKFQSTSLNFKISFICFTFLYNTKLLQYTKKWRKWFGGNDAKASQCRVSIIFKQRKRKVFVECGRRWYYRDPDCNIYFVEWKFNLNEISSSWLSSLISVIESGMNSLSNFM